MIYPDTKQLSPAQLKILCDDYRRNNHIDTEAADARQGGEHGQG